MMLQCKRCKLTEQDAKIETHHIIPKSLGGTDQHGRVNLCCACHKILHGILLQRAYKFIDDAKKPMFYRDIKGATQAFVEGKRIEDAPYTDLWHKNGGF